MTRPEDLGWDVVVRGDLHQLLLGMDVVFVTEDGDAIEATVTSVLMSGRRGQVRIMTKDHYHGPRMLSYYPYADPPTPSSWSFNRRLISSWEYRDMKILMVDLGIGDPAGDPRTRSETW